MTFVPVFIICSLAIILDGLLETKAGVLAVAIPIIIKLVLENKEEIAIRWALMFQLYYMADETQHANMIFVYIVVVVCGILYHFIFE